MAKVLFVQSLYYEYLGVMMLSACLKKNGHSTRMVINSSFDRIKSEILQYRPDMVAFSLMSGLHQWAVDIADKIKHVAPKPAPFIIFGGPHPTFFPKILEESDADAICIGEGEDALLELSGMLAKGIEPSGIHNLWIKRRGQIEKNPVRPVANLDQLPFADRSIYYEDNFFRTYPTKSFMTGRGCPYNCSFCYNKKMREIYQGKGHFVRFRSPESVIEEILEVKKDFGLQTVYFFDDTLGLNKKWFFELMDLYQNKLDLPFICRIRADTTDEEMVGALKKAGCVMAAFAVESGNESIRNNLLGKKISDADIILTASRLTRAGIKFLTYNMVGLPGETHDDIFSTIDLNIRIGTSYPWCSIFNPYPGTDLADHCIEEKLLPPDFNPDHLLTSYHNSSLINRADADQVANIHKFFQLTVLIPGLKPLVKRLYNRPNIIFSAVFSLVYFINFVRSERIDLWHALRLGLRNFRIMIGTRSRKS